MDLIVTIVAFVLIFSVLVLIHELGHFWAAKRAGIKVEEFGFGLPPRIWGKKKGETIYSINWIPFGGFVRMLGEDSRDKGMLSNKRSFIAQSKWKRIQVVCAGVVMNFLLAFVLLSIGFMVGIEPLIVNSDDLSKAINEGKLDLRSGAVVEEVEEGSYADELGFKAGDVVYAYLNPATGVYESDYIEYVQDASAGIYKLRRGKKDVVINAEEALDGLKMNSVQAFPAVRVLDGVHQWFYTDEYLYEIFDERLFSVGQFYDALTTMDKDEFHFMVYTEGLESKIPMRNIKAVYYDGALIENVEKGSPADKAGLKAGDVIMSVNDEKIGEMQSLVEFSQSHKNEALIYTVRSPDRGYVNIEITPDSNGHIGIYMTQLVTVSYGLDGSATFYTDSLPTSVLGIEDVKLPVYEAPVEALKEMGRLSYLTAGMFVNVIKNIFSGGGVPESVAGPVGIASITHIVVQDGLFATLRFMALLSLSLAVVNILPFPALDGGRLLFILIEIIIGRRVNQKWESYIHSIGFILLMLLILIVTYSDITRLF